MLLAVLDPAVLAAAAICPDGVCRQLLQAALDRRYRLIVSAMLLAELEELLFRPRFHPYLSEAGARQFVSVIGIVGDHRSDVSKLSVQTAGPDDAYLLALADSAAADCLVSGHTDRALGSPDTTAVLTPPGFLERLG